MADGATPTQGTRGAELGLPASGSGSLTTGGPRVLALVVDCLASALVAALVLSFVPGRTPAAGLAGHLPGNWSLLPLALDYVVGVLLTGQTLGMLLCGLRVVAVDRGGHATRVRPLQIVVRTALLFLLVPAVVFDRNGRGLHDRIAGVAVVRA